MCPNSSNILQLWTTFFINRSCVTSTIEEPFSMVWWWEEVGGYSSLATISSVRMGILSANMSDNNDDDLRQQMEVQEQTYRA